MRKFTFNRKTIYITEREYESTLARFDVKNAKPGGCGPEIRIHCVFCLGHYQSLIDSCGSCPLLIYGAKGNGCMYLLEGLVRKHGKITDWKRLECVREIVGWAEKYDKQARRAIEAIRKGILSAVRVKKRGGCNP